MRNDSVAAAFVDAGAGQFFMDKINADRDEDGSKERCPTVKRLKYTVEGDASAQGSRIKGGALGPDWHQGILRIKEIIRLMSNRSYFQTGVTKELP